MTLQPADPARTRKQGLTLIAAFVGMILSVLQLYALGIFMQPIEADIGWSRTQISSGFTVFTLVLALLNPLLGAALDRFGSRRIALMGVPLFALVFALLPLATRSLGTWWAAWALLGAANCLVGAVVWTRAVASLFTTNRGLAVAVALCGLSASSFLIPLSGRPLIDTFGWREALVILAAGFGGLALVTSLLLQPSDRPSDTGADVSTSAAERRQGLILMRSAPFLRVALAATTFSLVSTAFITSAIPMLTSGGLSRDVAAAVAASMGIAGIVGRLTSGFLIDRLEPRLVAAATMSLPVITAFVLLACPGSAPAAALAMLAFGLALGAEFDTLAVIVSRLFDLRFFGKLFATLVSGTAVAGALGPLGASRTYDVTGSYDIVLVAVIPLSLVAAGLIFSIGPMAGRETKTVPALRGEVL